MKIACRIMHHLSRPAPVELCDALATLGAEVRLDYDSHGAWWNARRCWLDGLRDPQATHVLVVHDDAIASPSAAQSIVAAVRHRPKDIISFFAARPELSEALRRDTRWVVFDTYAWGLALCLPRGMVTWFVHWCDERIKPDWRADDTRMLLFAMANNLDILCTAPSLFQHPVGGHGIVTGPNDSSPWVAKHAITDWSGEPLHIAGDRRNYLVSRSSKFIAGPPIGALE